ncbi:unnamed protein product [Acanthosepion pharaonis]|uniref:Uncharacterized protein n=1 Tax=Acanthosepion pharaonis TaxID=158019 RepID=A0A812CRJ8_ACAPH|nr:unnamed protein product [Sepia pharaonis]
MFLPTTSLDFFFFFCQSKLSVVNINAELTFSVACLVAEIVSYFSLSFISPHFLSPICSHLSLSNLFSLSPIYSHFLFLSPLFPLFPSPIFSHFLYLFTLSLSLLSLHTFSLSSISSHFLSLFYLFTLSLSLLSLHTFFLSSISSHFLSLSSHFLSLSSYFLSLSPLSSHFLSLSSLFTLSFSRISLHTFFSLSFPTYLSIFALKCITNFFSFFLSHPFLSLSLF